MAERILLVEDDRRVRRATALALIDEGYEVLALYEDIRERRGGVAVGELKNGVCTACGLPLSPMQRDEIKRGTEPIIRCENCRRLLVIL